MRRVFMLLLLLMLLVSPLLAQEESEDYTIHVVQRGENLFRIALGYGLTTEALANLNGINDPASIQVGQRLLVPRDAVGEIAQPDAEPIIPDTEQVAPADSVVAESGEFVLHTVLPGESLFQIALSYGTEVSELASANGILDPTRIFAGQQLIVPGAVPVNFLTDLPEQVSRFVVTPGVFIEGKTGQVTMRTTESAQVTGRFLDSDLQAITLEDGLLHVIFIGIPVFSEAGIYPLQVVAQLPSAGDLLIEAEVQVIGGTYGREVIDLLEGRDDLLNENVEAAEMALLRNAATTFNPERYFDDTMGLPAAAAVTSGFGTRRSYNGSAEFNRFHSGTDFAGAPGSPILAPADGR
ncbi:MAG: LysM peptidoglycan-binding domain-containing protein, partial [Chloroflexota bacterium]